MKVRDLIADLRECDLDDEVVLSSDEEGNSFRPLRTVAGDMSYDDEGYGYGYVYLRELTDEYRRLGYTDEDVRADGRRAVVLWP